VVPLELPCLLLVTFATRFTTGGMADPSTDPSLQAVALVADRAESVDSFRLFEDEMRGIGGAGSISREGYPFFLEEPPRSCNGARVSAASRSIADGDEYALERLDRVDVQLLDLAAVEGVTSARAPRTHPRDDERELRAPSALVERASSGTVCGALLVSAIALRIASRCSCARDRSCTADARELPLGTLRLTRWRDTGLARSVERGASWQLRREGRSLLYAFRSAKEHWPGLGAALARTQVLRLSIRSACL